MTLLNYIVFFLGGFAFTYFGFLACQCQKCKHFIKWRCRYFRGLFILIFAIIMFYSWIFVTNNYEFYDSLTSSRIEKIILLLLLGFITAFFFKSFSENIKKVWRLPDNKVTNTTNSTILTSNCSPSTITSSNISSNVTSNITNITSNTTTTPNITSNSTITSSPDEDTVIQPLQVRYLIIEGGIFLAMVLGIYALLGFNSSIKVSDFELKLSNPDLVNPSSVTSVYPYEVDTKDFRNDDGLRLASKIQCIVEGDLVFFGLDNDTEMQGLIEKYRSLINGLSALLIKAYELKQQGESQQRIAQSMYQVKKSLNFLLQNESNKKEQVKKSNKDLNDAQVDQVIKKLDDKELLKLMTEFIPQASKKLDQLNINFNKEYFKLTYKIPPNTPEWCTLSKKAEDLFNTDNLLKDLNEVKDADKLKQVPYLYLITSIIRLFDGELKGAIELLEKDYQSNNVKENLNVANLLSGMIDMSNWRILDHIIQQNKSFKNVIVSLIEKTNAFNVQNDETKKRHREILKKRYESALLKVKNDLAYQIVKQENLTIEEAEEAKQLAKEAYNGNKEESNYIDTLATVRMTIALRLENNNKKLEEVEAARRLFTEAVEIKQNEYDNEPSPEKFRSLKITADHLKISETYLEAQTHLEKKED